MSSTPSISTASTRWTSRSPMTTASRLGPRRGRRHPGRRLAHLEDAHLHLSRQPRHQGGQRAARAGCRCRPSSSSSTRPLVVGLTKDPDRLVQIRAQPAAAADAGPGDRLRRPRERCGRRSPRRAGSIRRRKLAGDRRYPPLDRGDRRHHHAAARRASGRRRAAAVKPG